MPPSNLQRARPELRLTAGPRAAEEALLAGLERHLQAPERWREPLVLVVPSRTLREHLQSRVVARLGPVLGVRTTTLFGLALEVTEDLAGPSLAGRDLYPLFARRLGRLEPALRRALESLNDGYGALLGPVRDLLDAGLDPALSDGLIEALAADGRGAASAHEVERAAALVRVASRTVEALAATGAGRRSTLLTRAAERVRDQGLDCLAAQHVWIYGFADASGVARDLIEALLDRFEARLYLDQPPDPAAPERPDAGFVFTRRFRERLESRGDFSATVGLTADVAPPRVELFRALGSDSEVREVGRRILRLLDEGARPEGITVVARQLKPYARAVRQHFESLGLPFSTYGALAAKDRLGRRAEALADLLERRGEISIERWLELVDRRFDSRPQADLRTGFATLGIGRLREAAALAADPYRREHKLKLPVRQGFEEVPDGQGDGPRRLRLRYRYLSAAALDQATRAAQALETHFAGWDATSDLQGHLEAFDSLLDDHLGWALESSHRELAGDVREIWTALPEAFELSRDEFATTVAAKLRELGARPLGGRGGGVQILDVVEARGVTSDHLFVLGLNRSVFPRVVTEDPLLPDALRGVLSRQGAGVLPDLPDKLAGFDEERFLFAQLMASSPHVTLSWQDTDDDQMPLAPSPLLERLRWASGDETWHEPDLARSVVAQAAAVPRSPLENGIAVALAGSRSRLAAALPLLFGDDPAARAAAAARSVVLDELDPTLDSDQGRATRGQAGPYYGFLGAARAGDPRAEQALFVTTLERLSGCPWQVALRRLLGLEPVPDPLAALPGMTPLLIGALVHDVLEEVVLRGLADPPALLEQARHRIPQPVPWPEPNELDDMVYRAAEALCRREGIAVEGFARVLVQAVSPHLEMARELDWSKAGGLHVLGAEINGKLELRDLTNRPRSIYFRADRLDLGAGGLLLTDYKTGKRPVSTAKSDGARQRHLLESVWRGERLQAVAYALAAGESGDAGRYLFIGPEVAEDPALRDVRVEADDARLSMAFERAARATLATWDLGTFFPRLVLPDRDEEPVRCEFCEVRDACLRGDSGARRRLADWTQVLHQRFTSGARLSSEELTLLTLWQLPTEAPR